MSFYSNYFQWEASVLLNFVSPSFLVFNLTDIKILSSCLVLNSLMIICFVVVFFMFLETLGSESLQFSSNLEKISH